MVFLAIAEILLSLYISIWREAFYNAIVERNLHDFSIQTAIFTGVALLWCFVAGISGYLMTLCAIKWREILNAKALAMDLPKILNANQRVQDDCFAYPDLYLSLMVGVGKNIGYVLVFTTALLWAFPWYYTVIIYIYSILGTFLIKWVASPLIKLNYDSQQAEATYRNNLNFQNFSQCIKIMLGMAKKQKHLSYVQNFYGQLGVVLPLLLVVPIYFTTDMTVGALMRFKATAGIVIDSLAYGANSFGLINKLLACRKRLKEINLI